MLDLPSALRRSLLLLVLALLTACGGPRTAPDPLTALRDETGTPRSQLAAMAALDERPDDEAYRDALDRAIWRPGYTPDVRVAAARRLRELEPERLRRTLRQQLPRMTAWAGLTRLCELIAEEGWTELSPALVSSWARPNPNVREESDRPEYRALVRLHGADRVPDVIFELLVASNRPSQSGLRSRCWELLHRTGESEQLAALLADATIAPDDAFLIDLRAASADLGLVPRGREEILWLRTLRKADQEPFWREAVEAIGRMPAGRRAALEVRDLPLAVAALRHDPELLTLPDRNLTARLESWLTGRKHYSHQSNYNGFNTGSRETLNDWRDELVWGDLAAMLLAARALDVPPVVDHLLDYAARDRADETTEYGGVIALDAKGRFEVREHPPRIRHHDQKFIAPQEMFDDAYTALFHFHFHVQQERNDRYAGPGLGDVQYADATKANCLVLTSVGADRLNVDYYRHGGVQVDLGTAGR